ncbi:MFS transporter [Flexivirga endophytica]|uniref:MFS transporter n=1 Tax=Flexivirga endophytica TaxID=1849103 RepID=A0A916T1X7_9MICO|nr:hypothetical protein [Flexivirga endophytica]GGB25223.1 MFS transporter [Flexivirga endophytica]GHB53800.1 MFS transporter [Flexivirga endophytica]
MLSSRRLRSPTALATACAVVFALLYIVWTPQVPDLAAQVARAKVAQVGGAPVWWGGWFGGITLPSYSAFVPFSMATFGIRLTGVAAVILSAYGGALLVEKAPRPRAGAVAITIAQAADLLNGRVTFTVGAALAIWALVAMRNHREKSAVALALLSFLGSPLAGFFVGIIAIVVAILRPDYRRTAGICAAVLLVSGLAMAILFPGTGRMPFPITDAAPAMLSCIVVFGVCQHKLIRATAAVLAVSFLPLLIVPLAIGTNATRLAWLAAVPAIIAYAEIRDSLAWVCALVVAIWPVSDLVNQLHLAGQPSSSYVYYQPLAAALKTDQKQLGQEVIGRRVEVVDTKNHWGSVYLASFSIARGWDRQADQADNTIFYKKGLLNPVSYRQWLDSLAVGWVAVPKAPIDYASRDEAELVRGGLPYLKLTWSNSDWQLYRVVNPAPLAKGGDVLKIDSHGVTLNATADRPIDLKVRYSGYIGAVNPLTKRPETACIVDNDGWLRVTMPTSGPVRLSSDFKPVRSKPPGCVSPDESKSPSPSPSG